MALKVKKGTYPEKLDWAYCKSCERRFAVFVSKVITFRQCGDCEKAEKDISVEVPMPALPEK